MKRRRLKTFCFFLSLVFMFGSIGIFISLLSVDKQTENNTKEFTATIDSVETATTENVLYFLINTKEYNCSLSISTSVTNRIDTETICKLQEGQIIFFRIENRLIEQFSSNEFVNIVSLRTTKNELISLDTYNKHIHSSALQARIACIIMFLIFLTISVVLKRNKNTGDGSMC